ncbi:MAG TPA: hypothetical protein VGF99_05055 [Myxococcota bacterium]
MRAAALFVLSLVAALPAVAGPNDIDLLGLVDTDGATPQPRNADFRSLVREMGVLFTPSSQQLAETTGISGFEFALDYAFHPVNIDAAYWQDALESPGSRLPMTIGARARKGFVLPVPLASEVEVGAQWLVESQMVNLGANLKLALNEGFTGNHWWVGIPDIAVTAGINRVVGSDDLDLLTVTTGAVISKGFGLFGSVNFAPFVGYQSIFINGSTRLVDAGPTNPRNVDDNVVFEVVDLTDNRIDRVSLGARIIVAHVLLQAGVDINLLGDTTIVQTGLRGGVSF